MLVRIHHTVAPLVIQTSIQANFQPARLHCVVSLSRANNKHTAVDADARRHASQLIPAEHRNQ